MGRRSRELRKYTEKREMKISWLLVLLQYATMVESKAKPRLDQTSEFTTFFLKKWHKLVKNEKLNNWDEQRTERFTRNLHKLKNKIVKGTENCKIYVKRLRKKARIRKKSRLN